MVLAIAMVTLNLLYNQAIRFNTILFYMSPLVIENYKEITGILKRLNK
jgi:hypothetical protein